jgi:hypothetical protein
MVAFPLGGGYEVIVGHEDGRISHRGVDGLTLTATSVVGDDVWALDGPSANALYGAGSAGGGGKGAIFRRVPDAGWVEEFNTNAGNTRLYAISVASPSQAWAAGQASSVYRSDGGTGWAPDMAAPFVVRGLKAFSPTAIYAVGDSNTVQRWNGTAWAPVATFAGVTRINEIRGDDVCNLWVVGTNGLVGTSRPPP